MKHFLLTLCLLIFTTFSLESAENTDYLKECWNLQVKEIYSDYVDCFYTEIQNNLYHSPEPWQNYRQKSQGSLQINSQNNIFKLDSILRSKDTLVSKLQVSPTEFLFQDFGDTTFFKPSKQDLSEQELENVRFAPMSMINRFYQKGIKPGTKYDKDYAIYTDTINNKIVKLFIDKKNWILQKITILSHNDMIGDVETQLKYIAYQKIEPRKFYLPRTILIEKNNRKSFDTINITNLNIISKVKPLLTKPSDYKINEDVPETPDSIWVSKYNEYLTFIHFKKADSRIAVVEFSSYFAVIGAPLKPENGELIIQEVRKLNSTKPIKYFAFGHHHPHYMGGVRTFANIGAKVISLEQNSKYLNYLLNNPHSIKPDSLQISRNVPIITYIKDSVEIKDGNLEMKIYHIGKKSAHANDFLVFYFPNDKLLLQDELIWIKKDAPLAKASARQAGLYNSIKDLNLNVETILQTWPIGSRYNVKSEIQFKELEESVKLK